MIVSGQQLSFSPGDLEMLGRELVEILTGLEDQCEGLFEAAQKAWSWYEAEKLSEEKTTPWPHASNVVIPTIQIHVDATHARYLSMLKSNENVWAGKTSSEEFAKSGLDVEIVRFLNWSARNEFDFDTPTSDMILEQIVTGTGVLALGWDERTSYVMVPGQKRAQEIMVKRGPVVEHIPGEDALWDRNYRAWDAPVFSRRSLMTWSDVVQRVNRGGWDWDAAQDVKGKTIEGTDYVGHNVTEDRELVSGVDRSAGPSAYRLYDFREVWIDWPLVRMSVDVKPPDEMEEGDELTTIVVFMHYPSGKIMLVTAKPYAIPDKPFYDCHFKKRSAYSASAGIAKRLSDIQDAQSTFVNQAADAVHKANSMQGVTTDPNMAAGEFALNRWVQVSDPSETKELGISAGIAPDMALFNALNVIAERITGINDPALGRETRMGGHPAPATSTLSLLQEGKKLDITAIRSIRQVIGKLGIDLATLYQQLEMDGGKIVRAVGMEDGRKIAQWMFPANAPIVGNIELDLAAVSETMNPAAESQKAQAIFQLTANYYALVTQYLQIVANPQVPEALAMAMLQGLFALQKSYKKILEASDEDDIKSFVLDLERLAQQIFGDRRAAQGAAAGSPLGAAAQAAGGAQGGMGAQLGSGLAAG